MSQDLPGAATMPVSAWTTYVPMPMYAVTWRLSIRVPTVRSPSPTTGLTTTPTPGSSSTSTIAASVSGCTRVLLSLTHSTSCRARAAMASRLATFGLRCRPSSQNTTEVGTSGWRARTRSTVSSAGSAGPRTPNTISNSE
jgi:hypothetical protein